MMLRITHECSHSHTHTHTHTQADRHRHAQEHESTRKQTKAWTKPRCGFESIRGRTKKPRGKTIGRWESPRITWKVIFESADLRGPDRQQTEELPRAEGEETFYVIDEELLLMGNLALRHANTMKSGGDKTARNLEIFTPFPVRLIYFFIPLY